jgi:acyl CoA:acetate/3-ketoacid CoA transferase beta subunit
MGGVMDLVPVQAGVHAAADRQGVVDMLITDPGIFEIDRRGGTGATLTVPRVSLEEIASKFQADSR